MIPFCKPTIGREEARAATKVLRSGWLAPGPKTEQFEKKFAKYVGVKYAIFTNSCTSALKMAYKWYKSEFPFGYLFIPKNTYCATYAAADEMGVACGFDNSSKKISDIKTVTHRVEVWYGGRKEEQAIFPKIIIEDSAHRIEKDDPLIGKIRCYSFYVTKNMTTGTGGMLTTNNKEIYEKTRLYWQDGISKSTHDRQHGGWNYKVKEMAGGYDGNDLAAAIGLEQLKKLPVFTEKRNRIRDRYNAELGREWEGNHLYCYFVESHKSVGKFIEFMAKRGIQCSYHYPGNDWSGVSLPIYPLLTNRQQSAIIKAITDYENTIPE